MKNGKQKYQTITEVIIVKVLIDEEIFLISTTIRDTTRNFHFYLANFHFKKSSKNFLTHQTNKN
jgi:hypothetical protein